ncbi:MAG: DUF58 domain-containing protein [Oscillochloris sp.]|nr:DUF58 domain-containing protein [Oscillochloris sp.]
MHLERFRERWHAAVAWLSLEGRLRPTRWWALVPGPAALALSLAFPSRWLSYIGYVYMLIGLACYFWMRATGPYLRLGRRLLAGMSQVGDDLEEQWEIVNGSSLPLPWVELVDDSTMPGYHARRAINLDPGERLTWRTTVRCERRGVYRIGPLLARSGDPFGLFVFTWRERAARSVVIYPPLVRLPSLMPPQGQRGGLARADLLQIFTTPSVGGLRAYVPGDLPSRIHWPHVARYDQLMIKVFDQERAGALWVVLDLSAAAYASDAAQPTPLDVRASYGQSSVAKAALTEIRPNSLIDLAVILACSLAAIALAEGRQVGLLAEDTRRRLIWPVGGEQQLWRILGELIDAQPLGGRPLGELLRMGMPTRAGETSSVAIVIITPDLSVDWLGGLATGMRSQRGAQALLVAPSADRGLDAATVLAAAGVSAHTFVLGEPLPLASPPRRRVKARVSPFGRVIQEAERQ